MNDEDYDYITHRLYQSIGSGNISEMEIVIRPKHKESTQVLVSLEIIKRFPINDIEKAKQLYEKIQKFHYDLEKIVYDNKNKQAI